MINNHVPTVFGALVVLAALTPPAAPATAAERAAAVLHGVSPTGEREYGAKLLVCASCHGEKGVPQNPTIPVIWGQQENYLIKQLHDFGSGDRTFEAMAWMASTLPKSERAPAASFFEKKSGPENPASAAAASPPATAAVCQV